MAHVPNMAHVFGSGTNQGPSKQKKRPRQGLGGGLTRFSKPSLGEIAEGRTRPKDRWLDFNRAFDFLQLLFRLTPTKPYLQQKGTSWPWVWGQRAPLFQRIQSPVAMGKKVPRLLRDRREGGHEAPGLAPRIKGFEDEAINTIHIGGVKIW